MNGPLRLLHARQPLQIVAFCRINAKPEQVKRLTPLLYVLYCLTAPALIYVTRQVLGTTLFQWLGFSFSKVVKLLQVLCIYLEILQHEQMSHFYIESSVIVE